MKGEITLNDEFGQALYELCAQNSDIKLFLEIGTGSGNGSTLCIVKGMNECQRRNFRSGVKLISIESLPEHHNEAKNFLKDKKGSIEVDLLLGASLTPDDMPPFEFFTNRPMIYEDRARIWYHKTKEMLKNKNDILRELISRYKKFDAVLIDGSGFLGRAEFELLRDKCKYIILDDTNSKYSYKNHLNRQEILANSQKWTVLSDNFNYRHGWMIAVNNSFANINYKTELPAQTTKVDVVKRIFDELESQQVNFVTLRGFNLIPYDVSIKQDVDLLIHPDSIEQAKQIFNHFGFECTHPKAPDATFLYGTHPNLWCDHKQLDIRLDVVQELAYKGLNKCEMVPMDKELQISIFHNKRKVDEIWKYMPSYEDEFLMLICRSIYDKRTVQKNYKDKIEQLFDKVNPQKIQRHCKIVFLKFTPQLIETIEKKETEHIFERYITFSDY